MKVKQPKPNGAIASKSSAAGAASSVASKSVGRKKCDVPSCQKCDRVTDDVKALQCDCCEATDA